MYMAYTPVTTITTSLEPRGTSKYMSKSTVNHFEHLRPLRDEKAFWRQRLFFVALAQI